ncbi:MAG: 4Fe-4S dicluster domain-containing protein [Candidatus Zixiibacteriota bacterium]|nr:MAG: 4Fe-4S dicluster domain-containing protein [candidate division Zixibacteria bacterium]
MSEKKNLPEPARHGINFAFREKLDAMAEGFRHNYCYQCGACVADCPAGLYSKTFNPRLIMLKAILGFEDELIGPDTEIWNCTNCYTCSERCPQDVRPVDVIIAMKNLCVKEGKAPDLVTTVSDTVFEAGITTKVTSLAERRRQELGLGPIKQYPVEDLKKITRRD